MGYPKLAISGKERKQIIRKAEEILEDPEELLPKKGSIMRYTISKKESLILVNKQLIFIQYGELLIPSIKLSRKLKLKIPRIVVDLGAIKFVTNGADIMRPGITQIDDEVLEGGMVIIVEERNFSPLSIGLAIYDAVDMREKKTGKCIKNLHWLKDKWFSFDPNA